MDSPEDEWVFGPNPRLDNIYQNVPQVRCPVFFLPPLTLIFKVMLHGCDEGLIPKTNFCCLATFIEHVAVHHKMKVTPVSSHLRLCVMCDIMVAIL